MGTVQDSDGNIICRDVRGHTEAQKIIAAPEMYELLKSWISEGDMQCYCPVIRLGSSAVCDVCATEALLARIDEESEV
jgi:hypothetical protein